MHHALSGWVGGQKSLLYYNVVAAAAILFQANYLSKMSLHWTLIAGFLYCEIISLLLLLIPLISPRAWNKLFKSRFLKGLESQLIYYFYVLVAILVLFFLGKCFSYLSFFC